MKRWHEGKFTREFKVSAVKLVNEQGYSVPEAAKSLGVDPNCVRGWVQKFSSEAGLAPRVDPLLRTKNVTDTARAPNGAPSGRARSWPAGTGGRAC